MSKASKTPAPISPDEMLPSVQPPSATFLVQLFVIPGMIVLVMVLVWMLVNWLPQMGNDAAANLQTLEGSGANRWQAAVNLANLLRGDTSGNLKRDRELAARLANKLKEELAAKQTTEDAVRLRVYLVTALGEFFVDTGLSVLVQAVTTEEPKTDSVNGQPSVRVAAVRAIAVLSNNLQRETNKPISDPDVIAVLIEASREDDALLRTAAAYALGEVEGSAAKDRLKTLLDDVSHPYARYNAATALARRGDPAVIGVVVELLSTQTPPETAAEDSPEEQNVQRTKLVINGLRAASDLVDANSEVDLARITGAIEKLTEDESPEIRDNARAMLRKLKGRLDA